MASNKKALTLKHKVGYGLGDLAGCMTFGLMGTYFTRYCTNILQVNTVILEPCWQSGTSGMR